MSSTQRRELVAAVDRELHALPEIYRPVLRLALQPPGLRTAVLEAARLAAPAALTLPATVTTAHVMENLVLSIVALVAVAASTWMLWDGGVPPRDGRSAEVLEPAHPRATD